MNQLAYRIGSLVTAGTLLSALAGCNQHAVSTESVAGVAIHGSIIGGQQPVTASTIQLYGATTSGSGAASNALLTKVITTSDGTSLSNVNANSGNANNTLPAGFFTITGDYTCPTADTQVYLTASGGNPGLASGTNNPALELLVALGSCGQLSASTFVQVNEVTTVGSIAALYPYMTAYNAVSSISSAVPAMAESFSLANEYMNVATGLDPGIALPAGYYASSTEINTLADAIAACINSAGNTSSSSACSMLFHAATPMNGTAPTDTVGAVLNILENPTQNVSTIFNLSSANAPFMPSLAKPPTDWTLAILPVPAAPTFTPAAGTFAAGQTVTVTSPTSGTTILYTTDGTTPTTKSSTRGRDSAVSETIRCPPFA